MCIYPPAFLPITGSCSYYIKVLAIPQTFLDTTAGSVWIVLSLSSLDYIYLAISWDMESGGNAELCAYQENISGQTRISIHDCPLSKSTCKLLNRVVPNSTLRGVEGEGQISPIRFNTLRQRTVSYLLPLCKFLQYQSFQPEPLPHWGLKTPGEWGQDGYSSRQGTKAPAGR